MCSGQLVKPEMSGTAQCHRCWAVHEAYIRPAKDHHLPHTHRHSLSQMPYLSSPNPHPQSSGRIGQGAPGYRSSRWRYVPSVYPSLLASKTCSPSSDRNIRSGPIFKLDEYSLLNIFHLYRLACLGCDNDKAYISESISGGGGWAREHWWCTLVRVCRKWRYLIFGSPSYLRLCIVYTRRKPVSDMLAHPPFYRLKLPLVIEYMHKGPDGHIPQEDKQEIILALQHRCHVRRIRLHAPYSETVFRALDEEFPNLECLYLKIPNGRSLNWEPPRTFQTPRLRQLVLHNIICPLQSLLLTPAAGLVTLSLTEICEPDKFSPNDLLQRLSLMPRLEILRIGFTLFSSSPAEEMQMMRLPIRTQVELPYLRRLLLNGTSTYLGALLPHISTPPLEKLQIYISNWKTSSIPYTLQLMNGSEHFKSHSADLMFLDKGVFVRANIYDGARWSSLSMSLHGNDFTWQVLSAAQFFYIHRTCFFTTQYLTIRCRTPTSSQPHPGPDYVHWRRLFGLFFNVDALLVYDGPHGEISRSFQMNHGESGMELFPRLKQLSIHTSGGYNDVYAPFINARKNGSYPVRLVRLGKGPSAIEVAISCEAWEAPWLWGSFRLRLA